MPMVSTKAGANTRYGRSAFRRTYFLAASESSGRTECGAGAKGEVACAGVETTVLMTESIANLLESSNHDKPAVAKSKVRD